MVVAIALLITVGVLIFSMPFLMKFSGNYRVTENACRSLSAMNLSEAGLERAGGDPLFNVRCLPKKSVTLAANLNIEGDVGVNGTHPGAVTIGTNSVVTGDVLCWPDGDPFVAINLNGSAQVLGQQTAAVEAKEFPSVLLPEGMNYRGELSAQGDTVEIT